MTNAPFAAIDDYRDIEAVNHYREAIAIGADPGEVLAALRAMGRDHAVAALQWDDTAHAGPRVRRRLAVNPNHTEVNAAAQVADPDSVFHHYRRLIELRKTEPAVAHGDFTMLVEDDPVVYAFKRRLDDTELLVVANFSGSRSPPRSRRTPNGRPATSCSATCPAARAPSWRRGKRGCTGGR